MVKRIMDIVGSLVAIILFSPLFILIPILIRFDSSGSVFFLQNRLGKDGQVFQIIKFRTMVSGAEKIGDGIRVQTTNDARITKIGRFLRATSLDELPQLFCILKGDMSLVGPRPPVEYHPYNGIDNYPDWAKKRFSMRPGVTGLAQVKLRNATGWDKRIELDIEYIEKFSILQDIVIMFMTVLVVIRPQNLYLTEVAATSEKEEKEEPKMITLALRDIFEQDLESRVNWFNHESARYMSIERPVTLEKTKKWFESLADKTTAKHFSVINERNGDLIGFVGMSELNNEKGTGVLYIIIGNEEYKGKGLAKGINALCLEWFFEVFGGQTAHAYVTSENEISLRGVFDKTGWKREPSDGILGEKVGLTFSKEDWENYDNT